jgi:polar amino acid transport system substrate-binding protein
MPHLLLLFVVFLGSAGFTHASSDGAKINQSVIKFITIDVAPWASVEAETGQMVGAFPELVEAIAQRTGLNISIALTPFARVDRELESGDHDCTILIPRDEQVVVFGETVSYHAIGLIARQGVTLRKYEDLAGKNISVLRGASIEPRFDGDESLNKQFDTDYAIALRKMQRQRVDAIAGAIPTIQFIAEQEGNADQLGDILQLAEVPLAFQCSRKSAQLDKMQAINQAIRTIKTDGTLDDNQQRHYI